MYNNQNIEDLKYRVDVSCMDPDMHWGLSDLFDVVAAPSNLLSDRTSCQMNEASRTEFAQLGESYPIQRYNGIENDEVIAHALQEELSELAQREAAEGSQKTNEDPVCASVLAQDWLGPKFLTSSEKDSDDNDDMKRLTEKSSFLDGEIGKVLVKMNSVPHVPKINGKIPTLDVASQDHQRLLDRLKLYGLSEQKMDGDGNCQFRAISDQLYRSSEYHEDIRNQVIKQLTASPELYEGYVPMNYADYLEKMSKPGDWGDHVTLQAAADHYGVRICLLTSFKDTCFIEILPRQLKSKRVIFLSFWAEIHYNSIYPQEGIHPVAGV